MISILRWELARRRWYILWWCITVIVLAVLLMAIYPSVHQQAVELNAALKHMPASLRGLRGGQIDLATPIGYLNAEVFYVTLPLLLIILAINLGGGLLTRDEQDHTLELLLARPVSRGAIIAGKAASGILIMLFVGVVASITLIIMSKIVGMDIAAQYLFLAGLCTTLFAMAFGALTFALSAASMLSRRLGVALAVIASFGGYLLQSLSSASDYIKEPAKFFPYHYYIPKDILAGSVSSGLIYYLLSIFVASALLSYFGFRRRDIG